MSNMINKIYLLASSKQILRGRFSTRAEAIDSAIRHWDLDRADIRDAKIKYGKSVIYIKLR